MNNGKQPAFGYGFTTADGSSHINEQGLTKREYFAVLLLQGMVANANRDLTYDYIEGKVKDCIAHADELLKQLEL